VRKALHGCMFIRVRVGRNPRSGTTGRSDRLVVLEQDQW
jgi:hypothetical protein